jgi:hypothetical protein
MRFGEIRTSRVVDCLFCLGYGLFYCLQTDESIFVNLLKDQSEIQDEVLSKGFFEILTVILIIHSIFKLGELCQIFEGCRRAYLISKRCIDESLRLTAIIGIVAVALGVINAVLDPNEIGFETSLTNVYQNSFSLDFLDNSENSTQVKIFVSIVRLFQQFIIPVVLLNLIFNTLTHCYDQALSDDFEQFHHFKAQMNLEFFGLLKSFGELPPLSHFEFQVSQELAETLENSKSQWHGFVKTLKNYIHYER